MDLAPIFCRSPIVYTTRLEEMAVLRRDFSKTRTHNIIESITSESKPRYRDILTPKKYIMRKTIRKYNKHARNKQTNIKLSFEELKRKVEEIKRTSNSINTEPKVVIESEIKTDNSAQSINEVKSLLSICKPLKIVLEDIHKIKPKAKDVRKNEVVTISSDSDDDVVVLKKDKAKNSTDSTNKINKSIPDRSIGSRTNYIIKNIKDFKDILEKENLKNSVLVIHTLYLKELNAYHIDENCNVIEHKTRKYTEVCRFPMKKCKLIFNIIVCCWRNRQSYVTFLMSYSSYWDIARFIYITHTCIQRCTCCCFNTEPSFEPPDNQDTGMSKDIPEDSISGSSQPFNQKSILIDKALKFTKNAKWMEYKKEARDSHVTVRGFSKAHIAKLGKRLLQINNSNGDVEFYEFGRENLLYSKLVSNGLDNSCWLFQTLNKCRNQLNTTATDPLHRENQIVTYRCGIYTECFLRIPLTIAAEGLKGTNARGHFQYKVEHLRSFMGANSKKSSFVSILPLILKNKTSLLPAFQATLPIKTAVKPTPKNTPRKRTPAKRDELPRTPTKCVPIAPKPPLQVASTQQDLSQTVNFLIKDILHRFRNVLLTINADGKVSATLNAPIGTLSYSELQILSQIISHAQAQVDQLGLTPGTYLNPEAASMVTNAISKIPINSNDPNKGINTQNNDGNIQIPQEQNKKDLTKTNLLASFSRIVTEKKLEYGNSFRGYLDDDIGTAPKITNVFSLKNPSCSLSENLKDPLKGNNATIHKAGPSTEKLERSKLLTKLCVNEIKEKLTKLNKDTESKKPLTRKRKTTNHNQIKSSKIRAKSATKITVDNPLETSIVSRELQVTEADPINSVPVIYSTKVKSDYDNENNLLRNLLTTTKNVVIFSKDIRTTAQIEAIPNIEMISDKDFKIV